MRSSRVTEILTATAMLMLCEGAAAQLRVAQWNITTYTSTFPSSRDAAFKTALYGIAPNGLQMAPDVIAIQEIIESVSGQTQQQAGNASTAAFLSNLNTAPGSPGDWAAAPYMVNGGDMGNAFFYRTSKVVLMGTTALTTNTGTGSNQAPRDTQRWQIRLVGYSGLGAQLYIYGAHFKAGSTSTDQARRVPEGERIRINANALPDAAGFLLCGDLNIQFSSQTFYQYLVGNSGSPSFTSDASGRFFDPINSPGTWENSSAFRFIHTQDPTSEMDSRHDQILIAGNLRDGQGMDYMPLVPGGNINAAYSTSTWNDPNHSYRAWGNDGSGYNQPLTTFGNTMVGPVIAQALIDSAASGGHLPVYLDLQVPAKVAAPTTLDFGTVAINSAAQMMIEVGNAANVALWSKDGTGRGIDTLNYTIASSAGFNTPAGPFADAPGGGVNMHIVSMDTTLAGVKSGTLTIASDDPDVPAWVINITGTVGGAAPPDYDVNDDGVVDIEDYYAWFAGNTDVNGDGSINAADGVALRTFLRIDEVTDTVAGRR